MSKKEVLEVVVHYGSHNQILKMTSVHMTPQDASELARTVEILVLGYPEARTFEQPENEVKPHVHHYTTAGDSSDATCDICGHLPEEEL